MCIYLEVNIKKLKLYEPSMLDHEEEQVLPFFKDFAPVSWEELTYDIVIGKGHDSLFTERTLSKENMAGRFEIIPIDSILPH